MLTNSILFLAWTAYRIFAQEPERQISIPGPAQHESDGRRVKPTPADADVIMITYCADFHVSIAKDQLDSLPRNASFSGGFGWVQGCEVSKIYSTMIHSLASSSRIFAVTVLTMCGLCD